MLFGAIFNIPRSILVFINYFFRVVSEFYPVNILQIFVHHFVIPYLQCIIYVYIISFISLVAMRAGVSHQFVR